MGKGSEVLARLVNRESNHRVPIQVAMGGVAAAIVVLLRLGLDPYVGDRAPYLTNYLGMFVAAWYGGFWSGATASLVGGLVCNYLFVSPRGTWGFADFGEGVNLILFWVVGLIASWIAQAQLQAQMAANAAVRELTEKQAALEREIRMREEADAKVQGLLAELRRSNRELQDFAFVASHDLQEPLRKIQAFGDRLARRERDTLSPEGMDSLQRMQSAAERMQSLINDLLTYSRVSTKAQPFVRTDLNAVLRRVLEDLQVRLEATHGEVRAETLPTLDADKTQMHQLLQNLIGNALKFARPGVPPVVTVSARREGANWVLSVSDNGIGFEPRHADRIFTIFQRLHGRGEYEGSGVGLAICRKIAERHGGSISAEGVPGEGATFRATLPERQISVGEAEE
jgi:light-regulated signal transduction histidine kinase (bacteriophytochrome)